MVPYGGATLLHERIRHVRAHCTSYTLFGCLIMHASFRDRSLSVVVFLTCWHLARMPFELPSTVFFMFVGVGCVRVHFGSCSNLFLRFLAAPFMRFWLALRTSFGEPALLVVAVASLPSFLPHAHTHTHTLHAWTGRGRGDLVAQGGAGAARDRGGRDDREPRAHQRVARVPQLPHAGTHACILCCAMLRGR